MTPDFPPWSNPGSSHPLQVQADIQERLQKLAEGFRNRSSQGSKPQRFATGQQGPAFRDAAFSADEGLWTIALHWPADVEGSFGPAPEMMPAEVWIWRRGRELEMEQVPAIAFDPTLAQDGAADVIEYIVEARPAAGSKVIDLLEGRVDPLRQVMYPGTWTFILNGGDAQVPNLKLVVGVELQ